MPVLLIATATIQEMNAALSSGTSLPELEQGVPTPWLHEDSHVLLLVTGVGILNTALHLGQALIKHTVSCVINAGLAGTFDLSRLPLGTTCVVEQEIWPEYGLGTDDGVDPQALRFPLAQWNGQPVWDRIDLHPRQTANTLVCTLPKNWPLVRSLTVSTVSATPARAKAHLKRYQADLENMEGFAAAYACISNSLPILEIRTISNVVGSREPEHWNLKKAFTALGNAMSRLLPEILPSCS